VSLLCGHERFGLSKESAVLRLFRYSDGHFRPSDERALTEDTIWIDLINPTDEDKELVEAHTHLRVPSIEALSEIESSSRLAVDHGVISLSTPVVAQGETQEAYLTPVGFILTERLIVTVRFAESSAFKQVTDLISQDQTLCCSAGVFTALLEAFVDRGADVLEHLGSELDKVSRSIFRGDQSRSRHTVRSTKLLRRVLIRVGAIGDRLSLGRDVLHGQARITQFVISLKLDWIMHTFETRLGAVSKDIASLNEYEVHLSNKVQFLLDAVLGFITIEQNELFKVLTIASVCGIPPVLIAGIYGMNFKFMPELNWELGYPFSLALIALSALIPLAWFKWRGWF
jgi:magnesium transporter